MIWSIVPLFNVSEEEIKKLKIGRNVNSFEQKDRKSNKGLEWMSGSCNVKMMPPGVSVGGMLPPPPPYWL